MKLGYIRVSTKEQNENRQIDALKNEGVEVSLMYIDKVSGKNFERQQYEALIKAARSDDIIVIKSLDRLGRNYEEIRDQFKIITSRGINIHIIDTPLLNTDQVLNGGLTMKFISDIILSVLGYVAEQERNNIKQRQAEGIASAKLRGRKFGRPTKINKDFINLMIGVQNGTLTVSQVCQIMNISRKTFYNYLNKVTSGQQGMA